MRVRFTPRATADLAEIADYLRVRNPAAAQRVRANILKSLEVLATFPYIGRRQVQEPVRKLGVRRYPYLVYYTVDETADEVVIISIRHAARRREYSDF